MDLRAGESAGFVPTGADAVTAAKIRVATHRAAAGAACAPQHAAGALVGPEGVVPNSQVLSAQKRCPHSQVLGLPTCALAVSPKSRALLAQGETQSPWHTRLARARRAGPRALCLPLSARRLCAHDGPRRTTEKQSRERILGEADRLGKAK